MWSNGATTATMSDIAGTYTVIVTDCNGCTTVCTVVIAEPTQLTVGTSNTNVTCQNPTGTAVAIVGGGTAPYTYLWSNGATTSAVTGLTPGTYTVTVNDANGCGPVTAQAIILAPVPVTCSTTATMSTCNGYHNGTATVTAGGGNGLYSIIWNTAPTQTTTTATGLAAGTYTVIVMDGLGCLSTCSVTVTEPAPMVYTYNVNNTCSGSNGGVATINTMGGTMYTVGDPYTYLWSNGQTTQTATGLGAGTVYVTITDSMGCSIQATVIVPAGSTLSCNTICTPTYCGQALGTATANVFGGTAPYIYQWSNGNNNSVNTGLIAGVYTVLITDANGCTTMCTAMVGEPAAISYSLTTVNALCNGGTGSITITNLNGGTAPYTYLWSDNSTLNTITGLAGTYTVTVTDTNGCSASQSATIVEPLALATTMSGSNVTCNGYSNGTASVVATGGTAPYSYVWNTGGSLNNIWNLIAGTYTVTVTDANGCIATNNIVVTQPAVLDTISTSSTAATCGACNGTGTATITGGTLPYTYLWGNGNTNAIATGLCGGNNFVVVTDANGCTITVCVKVNSTGGFTASLNSPTYAGGYNIRCNGGLDGAINLTTNPQGAYTYSWSNGATTEDLFGVGAGTYDVIVSYGTCTQAVSITLTEPTLLTATATGTNVGCNGNNNGTATASGAGGVMPYTYAWSNGQTTQTATGLMGGTYTVTIGDANGCTATASYTVTAPASGLSITESHANPTCTGNNGSINITVTGGTAPYTYIWTGGQTTEDLTGIGAGSHTVTVTDAGGCTISLCVVLTQPNAIVVSVSTSAASCNGGNNGSAAAAASGGTAPYSYLWSNGGNTSSITGLYPGTYTVTVTDAAGCTTSMSKVVGAPTAIVIVTDSTTNVTGMGGTNGAAYISVSGGTSPYTYTWNTIPVKTTQDVTGLGAGTYTVTVMDASGCISQKSIVITSGVFTCNTFHTETAVSWKTAPAGTNIGAYLNVHFASAFPSSLVVGGGCIGSKTLTLSNPTAVRNFLNNQPLTGGATKLTANLTNATGLTFPSAFGANLVALKMNVVFDAYDANFAPTSTVTLGSMIYQGGGTVNGLTVTQILNEANKLFGGCTSVYDSIEVRNAVKLINESWLGSPGVPFNNVLTCPAPPKATNNALVDITSIVAYPNPTEGQLNIKFITEQEGNVNVRILDAIGRLVFNKSHAAVEGLNDFALDISNLNTGVYMVNVQVNGMQQTIRVVVK
ncbi:MAG: T9SS type A sorting domain-containing protein [Bacteroidetes bacterium]|nr:T9SS type A sorting domain-containing protein [Bacteroidota bacterium]